MSAETVRESLQAVFLYSFVACPVIWFIFSYMIPYISDAYRIQKERKRALAEVIAKQEERTRRGSDLYSEIDINSIKLPQKKEKNKDGKKAAKLVSPPNFVLSPPVPVVAPTASSKPAFAFAADTPHIAAAQHAPSFRLPNFQENPWASLPAAPTAARAPAPAPAPVAAAVAAPAAAPAPVAAAVGFRSSRTAATTALEEERFIKQMQDEQYASSLAKDQAINKAKEEEIKKASEKQRIRSRVPIEPSAGASEEVITISFRFQTSSPPVRIDRRFRASEPIEAILDFVESHEMLDTSAKIEVGTVSPQVLLAREKPNEEGTRATIKDLCLGSKSVVVFVRFFS